MSPLHPLSLSVLLLLPGLSQALHLTEEDTTGSGGGTEDLVFTDDPEDVVGLSSRILEANEDSTELLMEGDVLFPKTRTAINCWGKTDCIWEKSANGKVEVPYKLSWEFRGDAGRKIADAMSVFHAKTCVRFVPRRNEADYLSIASQSGCFSSLGKTGGRQVVSLNKQGCIYNGIIQHELNHALGFYHEHTRSDRDQYVRINWENIWPPAKGNFDKQDTNNLGTPYDYASIMHYDKYAFNKQTGKKAITPIPDASVSIGQRSELSDTDILRINRLYKC